MNLPEAPQELQVPCPCSRGSVLGGGGVINSPPCRVCGKSVAVWRTDHPEQSICMDCCGIADHHDSESGIVQMRAKNVTILDEETVKLLPCPTCDGSGSMEEPNPSFDPDDEESMEDEVLQVACWDCHGEGKVSVQPCPHCASSDLFVERDDLSSAYVFCNGCSAKGPSSTQESDDEATPGGFSAIKAWNRRVLSPTTPDTQATGSGETERKRAVAIIHWVFSADGTKSERSMADEAINKINDPSFMPLASAPSASIGAMGAGPLGPQTNAERICFGRGMQQWRASLNRPDLSEEDRVKGALEAYCRMAFALSIPLPAETQAADNEEMKK